MQRNVNQSVRQRNKDVNVLKSLDASKVIFEDATE